MNVLCYTLSLALERWPKPPEIQDAKIDESILREVQRLNEQIQGLKTEATRLETQKETTEESLKELKDRQREEELKIAKLQTQHGEEVRRMEKEQLEKRVELEDLERKIKDMEEQVLQAQKLVPQSKSMVRMKPTHEELKKVEELENELSRMKQTYEVCKSKNDGLEVKLKNKAEQDQREIEAIEAKTEETKQKKRNEIKNVERELDQKRNELNEASIQVSKLERRVADIQNIIRQARQYDPSLAIEFRPIHDFATLIRDKEFVKWLDEKEFKVGITDGLKRVVDGYKQQKQEEQEQQEQPIPEPSQVGMSRRQVTFINKSVSSDEIVHLKGQ